VNLKESERRKREKIGVPMLEGDGGKVRRSPMGNGSENAGTWYCLLLYQGGVRETGEKGVQRGIDDGNPSASRKEL